LRKIRIAPGIWSFQTKVSDAVMVVSVGVTMPPFRTEVEFKTGMGYLL
jgi:hypothetical protein